MHKPIQPNLTIKNMKGKKKNELMFQFWPFYSKNQGINLQQRFSKTPQIFRTKNCGQKIRGRYIDPWNLKNNCFHIGVVFSGKRWSKWDVTTSTPHHPLKKSRLLNILEDSRNLASGECSRQVDTYVDTFVMWQLVREDVTKLRRLAFDDKILL